MDTFWEGVIDCVFSVFGKHNASNCRRKIIDKPMYVCVYIYDDDDDGLVFLLHYITLPKQENEKKNVGIWNVKLSIRSVISLPA